MASQNLRSKVSKIQLPRHSRKGFTSRRNCTTLFTLFLPACLNLKFLRRYHEEDKLALILAVNWSTNSHVLDCLPVLDSISFMRTFHIDPATWEWFQAASTRCHSEVIAPKPNCVHTLNLQGSCQWKICPGLGVSPKYTNGSKQTCGHPTIRQRRPTRELPTNWYACWTALLCAPCQHWMPAVPSILVRWGYFLFMKCPLCSFNTCTACHVLSGCTSALSDGWYTWRHNRVLAKLFQFVKEYNPSAAVFADIPSLRACESPPATAPTKHVTTTLRPVILSLTRTILWYYWSRRFHGAATSLTSTKSRKQNKPSYQLLMSDLSHSCYSVCLLTIKISYFGHYLNDACLSWLPHPVQRQGGVLSRQQAKLQSLAAITSLLLITALLGCSLKCPDIALN